MSQSPRAPDLHEIRGLRELSYLRGVFPNARSVCLTTSAASFKRCCADDAPVTRKWPISSSARDQALIAGLGALGEEPTPPVCLELPELGWAATHQHPCRYSEGLR